MSLPLWMYDIVRAKPGSVLVERVEMPMKRGKIILPDNIRTFTRSAEGQIHAVGRGCPSWMEPGLHVLLSGSAAKEIPFGIRGEKRLLLCYPDQILAIVRDPDADIENHGADIRAHYKPLEPVDMRFDEGDSHGLR